VCDEPFYAYYLLRTGLDHPGRERILQTQPNNWREVVAQLTGERTGDWPIVYQKQMAHHLLPEIKRDWLPGMRHCLLIREPRAMLTSLVKILPQPGLTDTGLPQQLELFEGLARMTSQPPPVIDSRDVLADPEGMLRLLCAALEVPFCDSMLCWPAGGRASDGVWAPYWYSAVEKSTGFQPYTAKTDPLPEHLQGVYEECCVIYQQLHRHRLRVQQQ